MINGATARLIAGCCGLGAFAVAIVAGLAANNAADTILSRSLLSLFVCYLVGYAIGLAAERAVRDGVDAYRASNPLPATTSTSHEQVVHATTDGRV
ncbi:MAG: hypothetical protein VYC34_02965 [Planctomycetota bacterium]|nr:hypothetical protein [Planctomycetota bacterium]